MGCMLVNDHHACLGLGDDVIFMQLRPRGSQGPIQISLRRSGGFKSGRGLLGQAHQFLRAGRLHLKSIRQALARGRGRLIDARYKVGVVQIRGLKSGARLVAHRT